MKVPGPSLRYLSLLWLTVGAHVLSAATASRLDLLHDATGIRRLDAQDKVHRWKPADGLISDAIWELHVDRQGTLWAGGHGGVSARSGGEWVRLGLERGLPVDLLWPVLRNGDQVCMGLAAAGLACIDSATPQGLTRVRVTGVEERDGAVQVQWHTASQGSHPVPVSIDTRYRFDGGEWSGWSAQDGTQVKSLSAGNHKIEVEARGMERGGNSAASRFWVDGPLYGRPIFFLPVIVSLAIAVTLLLTLFRRGAHARAAMQLREHHYRSLIENGLGGVTLVNARMERTYESPAMHRILGYEPSQLGDRKYGAMVHPDDLQEFQGILEQCAVEEGAFSEGRYRVRHRDGRWLWIEAHAHNLLQDPAVHSIVVNYHDVTAQMEARAEADSARAAAEKASRVKSDFLATMSHEIRTPMNGITGMASLLLDTGLTEEQREYAGAIRDSSHVLVSLINDVLDVARIESGRMTVEQSPFELGRVVQDVIDLLGALAQEKGLTLERSLDESMPVWFCGDAGRVRQVVMNLVGNAIKFTAEGRVEVRARGERGAGGRWLVTLEVEDSGIGIAPGKLDAVFEQFVQADASTTRIYGGTGLGLAISRSLARLMGGDLTVESQLGRGSVFRFQLALDALAAPPTQPAAASRLGAPTRYEGRRILLAEDNLVNQRVASRMLEKLGAAVDIASNGRQAVDMALAADYDMVLMDCQMPLMDGFEATRLLRASPGPRAHVPIAAVTANAMTGDREKCLEAGMDDFLAKPIDRDKLTELLDRSLTPVR